MKPATTLEYPNSTTAINLLHSAITLPSSVWGSDKTAALARLEAWLQAAQNMINNHFGTRFPILNASSLEMSDGRRYIRIDRIDLDHNRTSSRSVHVFIDKNSANHCFMMTHMLPYLPRYSIAYLVWYRHINRHISTLTSTYYCFLVTRAHKSCHCCGMRARHGTLRVLIKAFDWANLNFPAPEATSQDAFLCSHN
jgi:hypothetical protein